MKLKIPAANKVFKTDKRIPKKPSVEKIVMDWLNTEVREEILSAEPKLSPKSLKVTGGVYVHVPFEGYGDSLDNKKEFVRIVKAQLVPLGYDVEFTYDGTGMGSDICIVKWEHTL
jgi:hypothetical protein